jgi:hypothetical protein
MFYNYDATNANNSAAEFVWTTFYARIFVINKLLNDLKNDNSTANRAIAGQLHALELTPIFI